MLGRVPAAVADAAEQFEQLHRVQAAAPGHPVLAVGGEGHVAGAERPPGADLGGLLAEQGGPDAQFALALQRDRLGVDPADQDEVAVQALHLVGGQLQGIVGVFEPLPFGREELDGFHARPGLPVQAGGSRCGGDRTVSIDGHVPLLVIGAGCGITATGRRGP